METPKIDKPADEPESQESQNSSNGQPNVPVPPITEQSESKEGEIRIPVIVLSAEAHDSRFYNRLGFYCALDTIEDPNQKFIELLKRQTELIKEQRELLTAYFSEKMQRYDNRIQNTCDKIEVEKERLNQFLEQRLPEARNEAQMLHQQRDELETKFSERVAAFGQRKLDIIETAIRSARDNLSAIIEVFQKTYEKRFGFNDRALNENKTVVAVRTRQYELLRVQSEQQLQRLVIKMERLGFDSLNPALGHWLFVVGITIALFCGAYFFAVFALSKGISDSNVPFFLLRGMASFVHDFYPNASGGVRLLALLGSLLGFSIVLALIAWFAWKGLRKLDSMDGSRLAPDKEEQDSTESRFDLNSDRELSFSFRSTGSNFFRFWLQALPVVIVTGLVFFLVFLTLQKSPNGIFIELSELDVSLTGATIGALLTVMFGGLFSIYILKVVEPRAERDDSLHRAPIQQNIELVVAGILFICSLFALFFMDDQSAGAEQPHHPGAIFLYAILVIANGYLLGYSLRIRAIFGTRNYLERRTLLLARAIRNGSLPLENSLTTKEDRIFRKEYIKIQRELFHLLLLKTQLGNQALGGGNTNGKMNITQKPTPEKLTESKPKPELPINTSKSWWQSILNFFLPENVAKGAIAVETAKKEEDHILSIEDWETRLFPDAAAEIEQLGKDLALIRSRHREAAEIVTQLEEDKYEFCNEIRDRIRRLEESANDLKRNRERTIQEKRYELRALARQSDAIQADIRQGFNLGCWFLSTVGSTSTTTYETAQSTIEQSVVSKAKKRHEKK